MKRIGFAFNPYSDRAPAFLERGRAWCEANDVETWDAPGDGFDTIAAELAGTDFICVLGGDGTFLRTARAIGGSGVPALGVNLGRIGFLAKVESEDLEKALDQVKAGDYTVEEVRDRMRQQLSQERSFRRLLDQLKRETYVRTYPVEPFLARGP